MTAPPPPPDATIGLSTIGDDGTMHVRAWCVPPDLAATLAVRLTATFGPPDEMIADAEAVKAGGRRAAERGAVFLLDPDGGSHE